MYKYPMYFPVDRVSHNWLRFRSQTQQLFRTWTQELFTKRVYSSFLISLISLTQFLSTTRFLFSQLNSLFVSLLLFLLDWFVFWLVQYNKHIDIDSIYLRYYSNPIPTSCDISNKSHTQSQHTLYTFLTFDTLLSPNEHQDSSVGKPYFDSTYRPSEPRWERDLHQANLSFSVTLQVAGACI